LNGRATWQQSLVAMSLIHFARKMVIEWRRSRLPFLSAGSAVRPSVRQDQKRQRTQKNSTPR
jgi:hypothetical protein